MHFEQGDQKRTQEGESGSMPDKVGLSSGLQLLTIEHGVSQWSGISTKSHLYLSLPPPTPSLCPGLRPLLASFCPGPRN